MLPPSIGCVVHRAYVDPDLERRSSRLDRVKEEWEIRCRCWIENHCSSCNGRPNLMDSLDPFAAHRKLERGKTRNVSTWTSEIGNEALPNRIGNIDEDDWNRRSLLRDGSECRRRGGHDHVWF